MMPVEGVRVNIYIYIYNGLVQMAIKKLKNFSCLALYYN